MGDDEKPSLLEGLQDEPGDELAPKEFLIQESDLEVPPELLGLTGEEVPTGLDPGAEPAPAPQAESPADPDGPSPNEDPNPAVAVDQMLTEALVAEDALAPFLGAADEPAYALEPRFSGQPTFQLQFRAETPTALDALRKAFTAHGIAIDEKTWAAKAPVASQLNEFQAVHLLQLGRALGLAVRSVLFRPPTPPMGEDDLALGDLSGVPDAALPEGEGAPSVVLPRNEREVLLSTPDTWPGGQVMENKGVVSAHRSIPRRLFREEDLRDKMEKELHSVPGKAAAHLPSSHLQLLLRDLFHELQKRALALGANAVLGIKLETFAETSSLDPQLEQLRLVAFGTAAVVEKV